MCTKPDRANRVPCPTTARQRLIATHHDSIVRLADGRVVGEDRGSGLPPIRYTRGSGSRRRSSVTRYRCITSSCSACVTCRNCCSNGASSSPTRQSGPGANGSDPIRAAGTDGLVLPVLARGGGAGWVVRHCPAGTGSRGISIRHMELLDSVAPRRSSRWPHVPAIVLLASLVLFTIALGWPSAKADARGAGDPPQDPRCTGAHPHSQRPPPISRSTHTTGAAARSVPASKYIKPTTRPRAWMFVRGEGG
jgi:hypothetical protein